MDAVLVMPGSTGGVQPREAAEDTDAAEQATVAEMTRRVWRSPSWCERLRSRPRWPSNDEGGRSVNYPLMIALGLLFLAASFLVTHSTGRIALVVLSCVAFLIAVILTLIGATGV